MLPKPLPNDLPIYIVEAFTPLYRSHMTTREAEYFNPTKKGYRFAAPNGEYSLLYAAVDADTGQGLEGACVEGLVYDALLDRARTFQRTRCGDKQVSIGIFEGSLRLLDLTGRGPALIQRDNRLIAGPTRHTHPFGKQVFLHPAVVDGILYPSRHNSNLRSVAIFNRPSLPHRTWTSRGTWDGPDLWDETRRFLELYKLSLV